VIAFDSVRLFSFSLLSSFVFLLSLFVVCRLSFVIRLSFSFPFLFSLPSISCNFFVHSNSSPPLEVDCNQYGTNNLKAQRVFDLMLENYNKSSSPIKWRK
jgi:hypothetical protein